jgi:diguanylate cyclase (GGDEF)-like protein/PAS domain S-box-containing protein
MNSAAFQALVETSIQGILVHRDFAPLFANRAFAEMFGLDSADAVMGMPSVLSLVAPDDAAGARAAAERLTRSGTGVGRTRTTVVRPDGARVVADLVERPIVWDGEPALMVMLVDMTETVAVQREVQGALADAAGRLTDLLEAVPVGVAVFGEDGRLDAWNRLYAEIWGLAAHPLGGRPHVEDLLGRLHAAGLFGAEPLDRVVGDLRDRWEGPATEHEIRLADGRVIEETGTRRPGEGWLFVARDITQRKRMEEDLFRMATTDALTGVCNRRTLMERGAHELRRSQRSRQPVTVLLLDIDRFKSINDTHGHAAGDAAIVALAQCCRGALRTTDLFGRLGGEEFCAVLPDTPMEGGILVAENLRRKAAELRIPGRSAAEVGFTVSIGVATRVDDEDDMDRLLARADEALYRAKEGGRDRVVRSKAA